MLLNRTFPKLTSPHFFGFLCVFSAILSTACTQAASKKSLKFYHTEYQVELLPKKELAKVKLIIENGPDKAVKKLSFSFNKKIHQNFRASGELAIEGEYIQWFPKSGHNYIEFQVLLKHKKGKKSGKVSYDSYINKNWAIFRGDDLFPPVKVVSGKSWESKAQLEFKLPKSWEYVNTGWQRDKSPGRKDRMGFLIDNPERKFDRPTGWIIAGDIATRRDVLGETVVSVSGPERQSFEEEGVVLARMEILAFLNFVWPELQKLIEKLPQKFLIVGAADPMWRGGLSAPNSFFMHARRPLVSENGSSTLLHEVFHSFTRINGKPKDDWIAEGLAEFYSIELLYRAGGMTEARRESIFKKLEKRGQLSQKLRTKSSSGATTAKAVAIFWRLDEEIQLRSHGEFNLDHVVRDLMLKRRVNEADLKAIVKAILGRESSTLKGLH